MELKRIFNLKFKVIVLLIVILNCGMFYKEQLNYNTIYKEENVFSFFDYNNMYHTWLDNLEDVEYSKWNDNLQQLYKQDAALSDIQRKMAISVIKNIRQQMEYTDTYRQSITDSIQQAAKMVTLNIYNDSTSFGYHNILKSRYDFKSLIDIPVKVSENTFFDQFFTYKMSGFLLMVLIIMTVSTFGIQEKGFRVIISSTKNGRLYLNLQRFGIVFLSAIFYSVLIYIPILLISLFLYGGVGSLRDLIQCNAAYKYSMLIIPKSAYLLLFIGLQGIGAAITGFIYWILISLIRKRSISSFVMILLLVSGYLFAIIKSNNAFLQFLKMSSIFTMLDSNQFLGTYHNWGFGSFIISGTALVLMIEIVFLSLFSITAVIYNTRRKMMDNDFSMPGFLQKIIRRFKSRTAKFPNWVKECEKILILQKGYIILILLTFYLFSKNFGYSGTLSDVQIELANYYNAVQGDVYEASTQYTVNLKQWIQESKELLSKAKAENNRMEQDRLSEQIKIKEQALQEIEKQVTYIQDLRETGNDAGIVNWNKADNRYGNRMYPYYEEFVLVGIMILILLLFETFYIERCNHMQNIIRVTAKGRQSFLTAKLLTSIGITIILSLAINIIMIHQTNGIFAIEPYEGGLSIQSIAAFQNFPLDISINTFDVLLILYRIVLMISIAFIVIAISILFKRMMAFAISVALVVPHLLYSIGIDSLKSFSIVQQISFVELFIEQKNIFSLLAGGGLLVALGILSMIVILKKWSH